VRKLLVVALAGMISSKIHFGSFVPPEVKIRSPGFDLTKDDTGPRTNPVIVARRAIVPPTRR
jgi:hypothetical protein